MHGMRPVLHCIVMHRRSYPRSKPLHPLFERACFGVSKISMCTTELRPAPSAILQCRLNPCIPTLVCSRGYTPLPSSLLPDAESDAARVFINRCALGRSEGPLLPCPLPCCCLAVNAKAPMCFEHCFWLELLNLNGPRWWQLLSSGALPEVEHGPACLLLLRAEAMCVQVAVLLAR